MVINSSLLPDLFDLWGLFAMETLIPVPAEDGRLSPSASVPSTRDYGWARYGRRRPSSRPSPRGEGAERKLFPLGGNRKGGHSK